MARHGVTFNKGLGQNFLVDPEVCPAMAEAAGLDENTCAIEIGPGVGVLTAELAKRAGKVLSFELDERLLPVLKETLAEFNNVEIINQDVMKADLKGIIEEKNKVSHKRINRRRKIRSIKDTSQINDKSL